MGPGSRAASDAVLMKLLELIRSRDQTFNIGEQQKRPLGADHAWLRPLNPDFFCGHFSIANARS